MTAKPAQESATLVANAVVESVQYQGRKASRQGSEQRRQAILDAAMRIIVRDGVRAVRHRAVAAEADVPLSATTYYFKDINDLITDTFAQFVERSAAHMGQFWSGTEGLLREQVSRLDGSAEARRRLANEIARLAVEYVRQQLLTRREHLLAEQAFQQDDECRRQVAVAEHLGSRQAHGCVLQKHEGDRGRHDREIGDRRPDRAGKVDEVRFGKRDRAGREQPGDGEDHDPEAKGDRVFAQAESPDQGHIGAVADHAYEIDEFSATDIEGEDGADIGTIDHPDGAECCDHQGDQHIWPRLLADEEERESG